MPSGSEGAISTGKMKIDLNCDLGEGEPLTKTRSLMRCITSANVACGGHAGNIQSMDSCVRLAKQYAVRLGAHPGLASNFGRGPIRISPPELELLLLHQVSALERIARSHRVRLHHIKLHGSLYHATDESDSLARVYLLTTRRWWPGARIYARAGGRVASLARQFSLRVWEEAFADRQYKQDGSLVPRDRPNACLAHLQEIARRVQQLKRSGRITTLRGSSLFLNVCTICVHSDTPGAVRIARLCRALLDERL